MKYFLLLLISFCQIASGNSSEIVMAKEGAPSHISDNASILVWENGRYIQKVKGSNEFLCFVSSDNQGTFEPSCINEAARKAILPVYEFQRRMLEQKMDIKEIHNNISIKSKKGEFLSPETGSVVYMMSKRNKFYDHFGKKLVTVEPHIMLYIPKIKATSLGFNGKGGLPVFYSDFPHLSVIHIHTVGNH